MFDRVAGKSVKCSANLCMMCVHIILLKQTIITRTQNRTQMICNKLCIYQMSKQASVSLEHIPHHYISTTSLPDTLLTRRIYILMWPKSTAPQHSICYTHCLPERNGNVIYLTNVGLSQSNGNILLRHSNQFHSINNVTILDD